MFKNCDFWSSLQQCYPHCLRTWILQQVEEKIKGDQTAVKITAKMVCAFRHCWFGNRRTPIILWLGMLIPRKSHSRVLTETLDFARVHNFYQHDRSQIADGVRKSGAITGQPGIIPSRCQDPLAACGWSIDIAVRGAPETLQNSRVGGAMGAAWLGKRNGQSVLEQQDWGSCYMPLDNLRRRGARVETKTWSATGDAISSRTPGVGNPQTHCQTQLDDIAGGRHVKRRG